MSWRGFLTESKSFIGYLACGRLYFWRRFPMAWMRYAFYTTRDRARLLLDRAVTLFGGAL